MSNAPKPPIGLMPMKIYWEINFDDPTNCGRLKDIEDAIETYELHKKEIPFMWLAEKHLIQQAQRGYESKA